MLGERFRTDGYDRDNVRSGVLVRIAVEGPDRASQADGSVVTVQWCGKSQSELDQYTTSFGVRRFDVNRHERLA